MKVHTGDHKGDQLFHALCRGTNVTTVNFFYLPQHKTELAHIINGPACILANKLGINLVDFIKQVSMKRATFETWDPVQHIFTDPNDLHSKESMKKILQGTGLIAEDLKMNQRQ